MRRAPAKASTHTHFISGRTSQCPLARTPPHGPLRRFFGQFIGHDIPVELRMHWPHMRQSNNSPFTVFSTRATGRSSRSWPMRRNSGSSATNTDSKPR